MSATNRGAQRIESDFYPTPEAAFKPLLPFIMAVGCEVWEPAAGDGRLIKWMRAAGIDCAGSDLTEGRDFLLDRERRKTIVTNPPFSLAQEFADHAIAHAEHVFLLLRLNFLGAQHRRDWWRQHEPSALFILSERPDFVMSVKCVFEAGSSCGWRAMLPIESERPKQCPHCGNRVKISTSDSAEYAWFYWGPLWKGFFHL